MDIIELIEKIESISNKVEVETESSIGAIKALIDHIIKLEYRISDLEDEISDNLQKICQLKSSNKKSEFNVKLLTDENEFLMKENLRLITKLNNKENLKRCDNL